MDFYWYKKATGEIKLIDEWPSNPAGGVLYVTASGARVYNEETGEYVELAVQGKQPDEQHDFQAEIEYVDQWPASPARNTLYVTEEGARIYHGDNDEYVEFQSAGTQGDKPGLAERVDKWPADPEQDRIYLNGGTARIYHGDNGEYFEFSSCGEQAQSNQANVITTIPSSTTQYILFDSASNENNGSWQYVQEPDTYAIYVLPSISDPSVEHIAIVTVKFKDRQSASFMNESDWRAGNGSVIDPVNDMVTDSGDVIEFFCKYDPLQSKWVITESRRN